MKLATAHQMRRLDHTTIEQLQVSGVVLMELAGRGTVEHMVKAFGPVEGKQVIIFAGPGNNGGDGLVIARTVANMGALPHVYFLVDPNTLRGDAAHNFVLLRSWNIAYTVLDTTQAVEATCAALEENCSRLPVHSLVDALFGTGLCREVGGHFEAAISLINTLRDRQQIKVVAVDIPSGRNSDTGTVLGCAVQADLTITYGLPKPGHFHHGGDGMGSVHTVDIGIPPFLHQKVGLDGYALTGKTLPRLRAKPLNAHKGTNGHLLILAGSTGRTGAAILSARGSLRSGCGLVTLAVPHDLNPVFETSLAEAMTIALDQSSGELSGEALEQIVAVTHGKDAIVLGPGMGTGKGPAEVVMHLYSECPLPQVIDADALTILAAQPETLKRPAGPRLFTPHPGEMARLLSSSVAEVQTDRLQAAQWVDDWQEHIDFPLITILKGAGTVIASNKGQWCINTTGNAGMGTGGMGDVLSGLLGSLLAQGYTPWDAACLGVFLHGMSADQLAKTSPLGYTASEVATAFPQTYAAVLDMQNNSITTPQD